MAQTNDNRIKITHFINPHLFYFKWVRDEGYNDDLNKLEKKVEEAAKQNIAESAKENSSDKKIRMSEVVAVFVPDWHKFIRASVKRRERDDSYCVWAIDYGVPMIAHASNVIPLPRSFTGMQLNPKSSKRIHLGGMENCLPAEKQFNMAKESSDKQKLMNWSPQAIDLVQKILNQAIKLEFEHVQDLMPQRRSHYFGRLMMQRPSDGQMMNVVKSLLEMNMAVLAEQEFKAELTSIDSLSQPIIFSVNNELLDVKMCVLPVKTVSDDTGYTNSDIFESESENESLIDENGGDLPIEENEFFDDSASVMHPRYRNETSVVDALAPVPESQTENHANHSNSNASQAKSKSNISKRKSDDDIQNNNASQKVNNEKQQPKNAKRHNDRKQKNKDNADMSNRNDNNKSQQSQQQPKQQQKPNQQYHRQSMSFDQFGAQQRASNGEQRPNHSNFQHSHHSKSFIHPAAQNHFRPPGYRNLPDAKFNECAEFEASLGKSPPPMPRFPNGPPPPFMNPFPPLLMGQIPPAYRMNFAGMYGGPPPLQPGQSRPPRQSNTRTQFNDDSAKQTMNLMSMLNIQPQNHPSNANQRAQNRLRKRNSGFQGRFNQSNDNAGKMNANGNIQQRDTDGIKPVVKDNSTPSKANSEKPEKSQSTNEHVA